MLICNTYALRIVISSIQNTMVMQPQVATPRPTMTLSFIIIINHEVCFSHFEFFRPSRKRLDEEILLRFYHEPTKNMNTNPG